MSGRREVGVFLVGFEPAAALRLEGRLEPLGVSVRRAAAAEVGGGRPGEDGLDVLCFGPGVAAADAARFLRRAAAAGDSGSATNLVLAGGEDLSTFQDLVDGDRLFFLTRRPPPEEAIGDLLAAAVARVRDGGSQAAPAAVPEEWEVEARRTVLELTRQLARATDPAWAADRVARAARSLVDADGARCLLVDPDTQTFSPQGPGSDGAEAGESCAVGLVGYVVRTGRGLRLERVGDDPRWDPEADTPDGTPDDRLLAVPLPAGPEDGGPPWAVLVLTRRGAGAAFSAAEAESLAFLARGAAPLAATFRLRRELEALTIARGEGGGGEAEPLFRRRAVEHHAGGARRGKGRPLEVSPAWMRWTFVVLIAVSLAAVVFMSLAAIDEHAAGLAVVRADGRTDVTARVAGTVQSIAVAPGEAVEADQLLLRLHHEDEEAELARVEGELEQALAQRLRDPRDRGVEARLQSLRASRDLAAARLAARSLRAPHAGVVGDLRAQTGQLISPGQVVLSLVGERSDLSLAVIFPGHYRPQLEPGMPLRLELDGYRHAYQELEIERVAREAVGPAEARRILGAEIGDAVPVSAPVVFAWARLPASGTFHSGGRSYPYHEGLRGRAEVRLRSEPVLSALVPGLGAGGEER